MKKANRPKGKASKTSMGHVTIRMYNSGFGDCFLLAFPTDDGGKFHVLIDCGVHHQYKGGNDRMRRIAEDIEKTTGNRLDVVAITHEHTDHLTGFGYASDIFEKMNIERLWLAWTEDPSDPMAQKLKDQKKARIRALQAAISKLRLAGSPVAESLESVLGFDLTPKELTLKGNKNILEALRDWSAEKLERPSDYRTPGEAPIELSHVNNVRCYVLGPPKDIGLINKDEDESEMYFGYGPITKENAFMAAVLAKADRDSKYNKTYAAKSNSVENNSDVYNKDDDINNDQPDGRAVDDMNLYSSEDAEMFDRSNPFDRYLMISKEQAACQPDYREFFIDHYGFDEDIDQKRSWRRIDEDWLNMASELALNINNKTNNTSLVLAFELLDFDPPKVLLFAADAQVGNWLYWQNLSWSTPDKESKSVTGADLLKRTVFYKVGHHGSINATLREKGLEMMTSDELVAMIPVDANWASTKNWEHPAEAILKRLEEKTKGKVLRSDRIPVDGNLEKPSGIVDDEWNSFAKNVEWDKNPDPLWIQYTIR